MKIGFDIDNTLLLHGTKEKNGELVPTGEAVPNYSLIQVLKWFKKNGEQIFFWSAGGQDYCQSMVRKLGLQDDGTVIEKEMNTDMDVSFDDQEVFLAKVNIQVNPDV